MCNMAAGSVAHTRRTHIAGHTLTRHTYHTEEAETGVDRLGK